MSKVNTNNKVHSSTLNDEEFMRKLNAKEEKDTIGDKNNGIQRVELSGDEDYHSVDGQLFTPFNLNKELEEGKFVNGVYVENYSSDENDSESLGSDSGYDDEESIPKEKLIQNYSLLLDLLNENESVSDLLVKYEKDEDKLSKITDAATTIMLSGKPEIYNLSRKDISILREQIQA